MNKQASEILAVAREVLAGPHDRQTIAIFPGEHPRHPFMFWYLEDGTVWYTSGGNRRVNEGTLEEFIAKVQRGMSRAQFVENGVVVDHPPKIASVKKAAIGNQYEAIYDATLTTGNEGYSIGNTEIWYANNKFSRDAGMGFDLLDKHGLLTNPKELGLTHVFIGGIRESNPGRVMRMMQGEVWSPEGEARSMIRRKGLDHTSMSVGDVIRVGGKTIFIDRGGFKELFVREMAAKYPKTPPDAQQKKLWREQAEKRRRHEGIRPRK